MTKRKAREAMKVFVVDQSRCNGCYGCQIACKDEHCGNRWLPYADEQPETGHFWLKLEETEHGQIPKVSVEYKVHMCNHCDQAACVAMAPDCVYRREDGLVIIDPVKARGNRALVGACPHHAIFWNEELEVPQKCTGCAHLVDEGEVPRCVDFCPTGALRFGEEEDFIGEIAQAETLDLGLDMGERVYYLNNPKLFMGGEVWDPTSDEVIEAASITLFGSNGISCSTESDDFGDFYFRKLESGVYSIKIEAKGFKPREVDNIVLDKSLNLGDFPLERL